MMKLTERLVKYKDEPIGVLCARYWYRGILSEVGEDYILLTNPRAVEVTGPASAATPSTEDPIPSDLIISTNAIEQLCWPTWVSHELKD